MTAAADIGVCVADDGLINPDNFPLKSADLDTSIIDDTARKVSGIGSSVLSAAQDAQSAWSGLQAPGVFETPDKDAVYTLMNPAVDSANSMNTVTAHVAAAISTYATALEGIKPTLADFEKRAAEFRAEALDGYEVSNYYAREWWENYETGLDGNPVPKSDIYDTTTINWTEHEPAVTKNKELLAEYNTIIESVSTAASACANSIQSELTMVCAAPAEAITAEMLDANPDFSVWGQPVEEQRTCGESVGHGLGNFWEGTWTGAASLIGRDPTTGEWSWGTAGNSWLGVGDFALSTVLVAVPGASFLALTDGPVGDFMNDRVNTVATSWGSLIGWDQQAHLAGENGWHKWEEDGVAALTESAANIGTFFIPVAGWAGGTAKTVLTSTRVGTLAVKVATTVGEVILPAGSHLVAGAVRVVDLGASGLKGGWRALVDGLKPVTIHQPNGALGVASAATVPGADLVSIPERTPVSDALGLETTSGRQPDGVSLGDSATGLPDEAVLPKTGEGAADLDGSEGEGGASPRGLYDPEAPVSETVSHTQAPKDYSPTDVSKAYADAPRNEFGDAVDHRNGRPLLLENASGDRGWVMRWDPESEKWVAENRSLEEYGLPAKGEPGSFGYDENGDRMPYANGRPDYAPGQEATVWTDSRAAQLKDIEDGAVDLPKPDANQMWVRLRDSVSGDGVHIDADGGRWGLVEWDPEQGGARPWDMGHKPNRKYSELRNLYLNHEIGLNDFLKRYRTDSYYEVQDPLRNRAHDDE